MGQNTRNSFASTKIPDHSEEVRHVPAEKELPGDERMTFRTERIATDRGVPEALKIEADEYLFTLAGLFADVLICANSLTFIAYMKQTVSISMETRRRFAGNRLF